jgi:hypothetical protein
MKKIIIDIKNKVVCDYCDKDYTHSNETGGFLFGSYATCPDCAPKIMVNIKNYGEEHYIKGFCPPQLSFRDWVYTLREV